MPSACRRSVWISSRAPWPCGRPGSAVVERDVHREVVAHEGDHATVGFTGGSVKVTDLYVILADGRMGERVGFACAPPAASWSGSSADRNSSR